MGREVRHLLLLRTRQLKIVLSRLVPAQKHLYNGLAHLADYSIFFAQE